MNTPTDNLDEKPKANKWYSYLNNTTLFLVIILLLFISLILYLFCAYSTLNKSQQRIIDIHNAHTVYIDSTFCKFSRAIENNNTNTRSTITNNLDSVINTIFVEDDTLRSVLTEEKITLLNEFFSKLIIIEGRANNIEQFSREFNKDSLLMHNEMLFAQQQVQSMLELHLNKIEHEYTNITIWAAVLTIIFLVFSFYSMFKIEEAKKEAKETLAETTQKANDAMASIQDKTLSANTAIANISTRTDSITEEYKSKIEALIGQYEEKLKGLNELEKAAEDILSRMNNKETGEGNE